MAFCTNCGANMDPNAQFCTKCGKNVTPSATAPSAAAAAPAAYAPSAQGYTPAQPSSGGSKVLIIILVVIGVFVLIGALSIGGMVYFAHHVRNRMHVAQDGKNSSVDFGGFKASTNTTNARDLAHKAGIDLYPGATQHGESSEAQFGNMTTATIHLVTNDSVDKVGDFYQSRYPRAIVSHEDGKTSLVATDNTGTLTINIEPEDGQTAIEIAKVGGLKIETH